MPFVTNSSPYHNSIVTVSMFHTTLGALLHAVLVSYWTQNTKNTKKKHARP